jgi:UDP-N-acetylmuramoyl-tripeptide--D-alanyl-D-alanine ligase
LNDRPRALARLGITAIGALGWLAYNALLLRRSLHILQVEGYQTARFLRWWLRRPTRVTAPRQAAGSALGLLLALITGRSPSRLSTPGALAWSALGFVLARRTRFPEARKPLVMTARARRLVAGEALLALALAVRSSIATGRGRGLAAPGRLATLLAFTSLLAPLVTAAANLLLYPLEEALRRYYLRDAAAKLRRLRPIVVAVAGSYGKTSTKEFIATILESRYEVLKPPGSHNTPMGLARVIREQLEPRHEVFVAELGDWVPGDIAALCGLLRPCIGVLTAIGPEHLERFKTMERVTASKRELLEALPPNGTAVINQDDELVRGLADRTPASAIVRFGLESEGAQVRAREVGTSREGLDFVVEAEGQREAAFKVGVLGRHNVANLLAATATALALGMTLDEIARAAGRIRPVEHRLQPIEGAGGVLVIDDAFNSNPRGAAAALDALSELDGGRRILVTPGMVELAEREFEENRRFAGRAAGVCDAVIVVGHERAAPLVAGLRDGGFPDERLHVVRDLGEAAARLGTLVRAGDVVLFENDLPDTYADAPGPSPGARAVRNGAVSAPTGSSQPRAFLQLDGHRLAYRASGEGRGAPPVVLLHGWGASIEAVAPIQDGLDSEFQIISFDLPGFGQSDVPPATWGSQEYAELIKQALDHLELTKVSLIGHSRGGAVSIALATRWPELVDRLVLANSAGIRHALPPLRRARVLAFKAARRLAGPGPLSNWLVQRFGSPDYRHAGPLRSTLVRLVNEDLRPLLPRVAAPTLLIWGDQDQETPLADASIMQREIADAGLVVFPGAGHFSYAEDPGRFCWVVRNFLRTPC